MRILYLGAGNKKAQIVQSLPEIKEGYTRVVCISDTHNEHDSLHLPFGHLLLHAGDVMTESADRHLFSNKQVMDSGKKLLHHFAAWFGGLPHPYKAFIGGNHDGVMDEMGAKRVDEVLSQYCKAGSVVYLENDSASVDGIKIFGSPYAHWGGHNRAFFADSPDFRGIEKGTHIVLTHMPPILPSEKGQSEDQRLTDAMHKAGSLLHVGGHCHWAHGVHFSSGGVPCVVASVCESVWRNIHALKSGPRGARGDSADVLRGGYNIYYPIVVCDLPIPPPRPGAVWTGAAASRLPRIVSEMKNVQVDDVVMVDSNNSNNSSNVSNREKILPALLFFGPPTDPEAVRRLVPMLSSQFQVVLCDDVKAAIKAIEVDRVKFVACIAKLGSVGNMGEDCMKSLRKTLGGSPYLILHSLTAFNHLTTKEYFKQLVQVDLFVEQNTEQLMFEKLASLTSRVSSR